MQKKSIDVDRTKSCGAKISLSTPLDLTQAQQKEIQQTPEYLTDLISALEEERPVLNRLLQHLCGFDIDHFYIFTTTAGLSLLLEVHSFTAIFKLNESNIEKNDPLKILQQLEAIATKSRFATQCLIFNITLNIQMRAKEGKLTDKEIIDINKKYLNLNKLLEFNHGLYYGNLAIFYFFSIVYFRRSETLDTAEALIVPLLQAMTKAIDVEKISPYNIKNSLGENGLNILSSNFEEGPSFYKLAVLLKSILLSRITKLPTFSLIYREYRIFHDGIKVIPTNTQSEQISATKKM